jgi:NADH dehydrogenase
VAGKKTTTFRYNDTGSLTTIGRNAAVAQIGQIRLTGFVAWSAWLAIHIVFLIGFRNRVLVLLQWAWAYIVYDRGARVITQPWTAPKTGARLATPNARPVTVTHPAEP